jgi:hypothetical protein
VQHGDVAEAAGGGQGHRVRGCVRIGGGQAEPGRGHVADKEGGDRQAQFVREIGGEDVAQDLGAAFYQESRY